MIIFTVTNKETGQTYVGVTRNDLDEQWKKIVNAAHENLNFPLYDEIRLLGADQFIVEEYDYAETRGEAREIEKEAMARFNAISLQGYKTTMVVIKKSKPSRRRVKKSETCLKNLFTVDPDNDPELQDSLLIESDFQKNQDKKKEVSNSGKDSVREECDDTDNQIRKPEILDQKEKCASQSKPIEDAPSDNCSENVIRSQRAEYAKVPDMIETSVLSGNNRTLVETAPVELSVQVKSSLDRLQAAAMALLDGDMDAARNLAKIPVIHDFSDESLIDGSHEASASQGDDSTSVDEALLSPQQTRIKEAMFRHREAISQRTPLQADREKEALKETLNKLLIKADEIKESMD